MIEIKYVMHVLFFIILGVYFLYRTTFEILNSGKVFPYSWFVLVSISSFSYISFFIYGFTNRWVLTFFTFILFLYIFFWTIRRQKR